MWSEDWVDYLDHSYKFFSDLTITADQARVECGSHAGLLVSVNSPQELEFIELSVLRKRTLSAFIGGFYDQGTV